MAYAEKLVLHSYHSSAAAWRVRIALAFKEIPYEYKAWDLFKGEHLTEEYTKICPTQLVPALQLDGSTVTDSIVILEFLEERFPGKKPLLPNDIYERAAIRSFVLDIASGIQPLVNLRVLKAVAQPSEDEKRKEWVRTWITKGFDALERTAEKNAGKFSFGDEFTLADVVLAPQLYQAMAYDIDLGKYPTLQKLSKSVLEHEAVQKSRAEAQPDYAPK